MTELNVDQVEAAAARVVEHFLNNDRDGYFAQFTADARFVFYNQAAVLETRQAYEEIYDSWLESGWRVTGCKSHNHFVQLFDDSALFTHDVDVRTETSEGVTEAFLRESIVFQKQPNGELLAVHEHLSAKP